MSAIGDLVVNLVARTKQFTSPIRDAMGSLSELAERASSHLGQIASSATNVGIAAGMTSGAIYGIATATQALGGSVPLLSSLAGAFGIVAKAAGGTAIAAGGISLVLARYGPQSSILDRIANMLGKVSAGAAVLKVGLDLIGFALTKMGRDASRIQALSGTLGQIATTAFGVQVGLRAATFAARTFVAVIGAPVRLAVAAWRTFAGAVGYATSALTAAAGAAGRATSAIASTAAMIAGSVSPALMMLAGPLSVATAGLAVVGGLGWGVKLAVQAEQAEVSFTTMLKSADAAKSMLSDLSKFAVETPYESPEVIGAAKQLLAYGVEANSIQDTLRTLGDVASGVSAPLGDIAYLFGTAKTQGRLFAQDINQFTNRGIPIIEALASTMGIAQSSVKELVSEGKVGFPELQGAFKYLTKEGGQFSGMMAAQSKTMAGLWSSLKDNLGMTFRQIAEQFMAAFDVKDVMAKAIAGLESLRAAAVALGPQIQEVGRLTRSVFDGVAQSGQNTFATIGVEAAAFAANLGLFFEFAGARVAAQFAKIDADAEHILVSAIPAYLTWLKTEWFAIFSDLTNLNTVVMSNAVKNMANAWDWLLSYIRGKPIQMNTVDLMDGFQSSIKSLPEIPKRALSELEIELNRNVVDLENRLGEALAGTQADIAKWTTLPSVPTGPAAPSTSLPLSNLAESLEPTTQPLMEDEQKSTGPNFAGALTRGSQEAMSAINRAMAGSGPESQKQHNQKMEKLTAEMLNTLKGLNGQGVDYDDVQVIDFGYA
jgi:tape measure domain-containing protein